jgi:Polysaccharide lyase family 8, N terminal alpha-helical domain
MSLVERAQSLPSAAACWGAARASSPPPATPCRPWRQVLYAVEKSFAPVLYRGLVMDTVRGRSISRGWTSDHADGHLITGSVLRLAQTAEPEPADRLRALANGWSQGLDWSGQLPRLFGRPLGAGARPRPGEGGAGRLRPAGGARAGRSQAVSRNGPSGPSPARMGRRDRHVLEADLLLREHRRREPARLAHRLRHDLRLPRRTFEAP